MATLPEVNVTGLLYAQPGQLYNGTVTFRRNVLLRHADGTALLPGSFDYAVIDGEVDVPLMYTDHPAWSPQDWAWEMLVRVGSVTKQYSIAPSVDDPDVVTLGDLLAAGYTSSFGNEVAPINHAHLDLASDAELAAALLGKANSVHTHTAAQVTDLATAVNLLLAASSERITTSPAGEYVQRRKDVNTNGGVTTGVIYLSHFTALETKTRTSIVTTTQGAGTVAVGGTHAWNGVMSWTGTQYLPLAVSEDQPTRWSTTFTEYNTPIYAVNPGTGLANLASPGWNEVAGQQYAYWKIWTGSGTFPSLPACILNTLDSLVGPRDAGFMNLSAPPSGPIEAAWLSPLGRCFQAHLR